MKKLHSLPIPLLFIAVFSILTISSLFFPNIKSITLDEGVHYHNGKSVLSGETIQRIDRSVSYANLMPAQGVFPFFSNLIPKQIVKKLSIFINSSFKDSKFYLAKLISMFGASLMILSVFLWAKEFYSPLGATLGLILISFDPNIIAHSRVITQDILTGTFFFTTCFISWKYLKSKKKLYFLLLLVSFIFANLTRVTALILFPILFIQFFLHNKDKLRRNFTKASIFIFVLAFVFVLAINVGYSFSGSFKKSSTYKFESNGLKKITTFLDKIYITSIPLPYAYVKTIDFGQAKMEKGIANGPTYLNGRIGIEIDKEGKTKNVGFISYYFYILLYKLPLGTLFLLIISLFLRFKNKHKLKEEILFIFFPALFYFVFMSVNTSQLGIRYIMPVLPFIYLSIASLSSHFSKYNKKLFIVTLPTILSVLSFFPHYLSYTNELIWDKKKAYKYLADSNLSWKQNSNYIRDYLEKNPDIKLVRGEKKLKVGKNLIDVNYLLGILKNGKKMDNLMSIKEPIRHVVHSHLLYELSEEDIAEIKVKQLSFE